MKRSSTIGRRRPNKTVKSGQASGRNGGTARKIVLKCWTQDGPVALANTARRARHARNARRGQIGYLSLGSLVSLVPHFPPIARQHMPCGAEKSCVIFCEPPSHRGA